MLNLGWQGHSALSGMMMVIFSTASLAVLNIKSWLNNNSVFGSAEHQLVGDQQAMNCLAHIIQIGWRQGC